MDDRINELEIRYTHQQELIHELSDVVREQAEQLAALQKVVEQLMGQLEANKAEYSNEPPPHY